jgi:Tfp pilus assembly protein PilF
MINLFSIQYKVFSSAIQSCVVIFTMICCSFIHIPALAQQDYNAKERPSKAIGTIEMIHRGSKHSHSYSIVSFEDGYGRQKIRLSYAIDAGAYFVGDKLMVEYDPANTWNAKILFTEPYFDKGELPDTTEGVLISIRSDHCWIFYKTFTAADSLDIKIKKKLRYLSPQMRQSIKPNVVYKIIYNKNASGHTKAEILFNEMKDSTHQALNKELFKALRDISKRSPGAAIRALNKCIVLDPKNSVYYFQKAKAQQKVHNYTKALESINKYISMNQGKKSGYIRRAILYIVTGNYDAAQKDVTTLSFIDSQDDEVIYLQGVLYYHKKEYEKAIESYTNAIHASKRKSNEVYYYDRAVAEKKLKGKKNSESKTDFEASEIEARKTHEKKIYGSNRMHPVELHYKSRNFYVSLTSDNSFTTTSSINSNMQLEFIIPYTNTYFGNPIPFVYDKTISLNSKKQSHSFSIGTFSLELGGLRNMYGRIETSLMLNNGGTPGILKPVLGYNVKLTKNDKILLRPEIGLSYISRASYVGSIHIGQHSSINLLGKDFAYYSNNGDTPQDAIRIYFHENVANLSPALGAWLLPYSSKLVMRISLGYNLTVSQNYYLEFNSNNTTMSKDFNEIGIKYINTNGHTSKFFNYNGLFMNLGLGVRF